MSVYRWIAPVLCGFLALVGPAGGEEAPSVWQDIPLEAIVKVQARMADEPTGLGPRYHDRAAWESAFSAEDKRRIFEAAEEMLTTPLPPWEDEAYLAFSRTGLRPDGERMMAARHRRLAPLVLAECIENSGRFLGAIDEVLRAICEEPTWTLPAHDRDLKSFSGEVPYVDLNASRVAGNLAEALHVLDDKVGPGTREVIRQTLQRRVFGPVDRSFRTGVGHWWLETTNNWNAVCLAGVTGAALTTLPDPGERARFAAGAARHAVRTIEGFNNDGYCSEGLGYFNYGFRHYLLLREYLFQATSGYLDLLDHPKVARIARYPVDLEMNPGVWPAVADCRFNMTASPFVMWYLNEALQLGLEDYRSSHINPLFDLRDTFLVAFHGAPSRVAGGDQAQAGGRLSSWFEETGFLVSRPLRPDGLSAAMKGGHNAEHHNHNDVGSFSIAVGPHLLMGDPGGPHAYNAGTFGPDRYVIHPSLASIGHPVPLPGGVQQRAGRDAQARVLDFASSGTADHLSLDLSSAYSLAGLESLQRSFHYDRSGQGSLVVTDTFAFTAPSTFETALTTHYAWRQTGPNSLEFSEGDYRLLAVIETETGEITLESLEIADSAPAYTRIGIRLKGLHPAGQLSIRFSPGERSPGSN